MSAHDLVSFEEVIINKSMVNYLERNKMWTDLKLKELFVIEPSLSITK